ncbi:RPA1A, partial [Symbiodinium sp. CCMP2456]
EPSVRWICQFSVSDHTGTQYMSSFDDVGQVIMGCKAEEVGRRWDRREEDSVQRELERLFNAGLHKRWRIRVKSRKEFWNDEEKLKFTAVEMTPIDLVQ